MNSIGDNQYNDVTWVSWRVQSLATQSFVQKLIQFYEKKLCLEGFLFNETAENWHFSRTEIIDVCPCNDVIVLTYDQIKLG